jgi:hypothetical protein
MLILTDSISKYAIVFSLMTVMIGSPALAWWPFKSDEEKFAEACEDIIKERLKAPSTYHRVDLYGPLISMGTWQEAMGWDFPEKKESSLLSSARSEMSKRAHDTMVKLYTDSPPTIARLFIDYEAANSFGVPIPQKSVCQTVVHADGELLDALPNLALLVDGFSSMEWSVEQVLKNR